MVDTLRGGFHPKLFTHRSIDEISLQAAFCEEFSSLCRNSVIIEERSPSSAWNERIVHDIHEWRNDLFAKFSYEERSLLLQSLSVHRVKHGLEEVPSTRRLQYHSVATACCRSLPNLLKRPSKSGRSDSFARHLSEEKTRFAPTIHGMLTVFTFHGNDACQRAVATFLVTVKPVTDEVMRLMLPVSITRLHTDDALVCSIHLRSCFLEQIQLLFRIDFRERGIEVLQVRSATFIVSAGVGKRSSLVWFQQASRLVGFLDELADSIRLQIVRVEETVATIEEEIDGERKGCGSQHLLHFAISQDDVIFVILKQDKLVVELRRKLQDVLFGTIYQVLVHLSIPRLTCLSIPLASPD